MSAPPTVRVLLAEDVPADAELAVRELKRAGLRTQHRVVDDESGFEQALRDFVPDVILSDFNMPSFDGMGRGESASAALDMSGSPQPEFQAP